jgi:fluoroquinolone resistance protein
VNCKLHEVEFIEADLTNARFEGCDLSRATFENTILSGTDFRSAFNFSIDPEINKMKKAKFSTAGLAGLLDKYEIAVS